MGKKEPPYTDTTKLVAKAMFLGIKNAPEEVVTSLIAKAITATAKKGARSPQGEGTKEAFHLACSRKIERQFMKDIDKVYFAHKKGKDEEKIQSAIASYVKLEENERVILVYDPTFLGSAEEGIALTTKRVFVCEGMRKQSVRYRYLKAVSCKQDGKEMILERTNGGVVSLGDVGSKERAQSMRLAIEFMQEELEKQRKQPLEPKAAASSEKKSAAEQAPAQETPSLAHRKPEKHTKTSAPPLSKEAKGKPASKRKGKGIVKESVNGAAKAESPRVETIRPEALQSFQASAAEGAELARAVLAHLERIADQTGERLQAALQSSRQAYQKDDPLWDSIEQESQRLSAYGKQEVVRIRKDIDNRAEKMSEFTITVFGKTTVGKSTLMETLRHGDGSTIGKGGQRTTQDVRRYPWQGLAIYDVPGVEAFGGEADTEAAFQAARNGDVILFLMNDNALQQGEAACLARLCAFGKPVLGVLNVRMKTTFSLPLLQRRVEARYASQELKDIIRQAQEYGRNFGQDWSRIHFIPAHLKCAFEAQQTNDAEKREAFAELSHFDDITETLSHYVMTQGSVLRWRSFVDIVYSSLYQLLIDMKAYHKKNAAFAQHLTEVTGSIAQDIAAVSKDCERGKQSLLAKMKKDLGEFRRTFAANFAERKEIQVYFQSQLEARQQAYQRDCETFVAQVNTQMQKIQQKLQEELKAAYRVRASEFHIGGLDLEYEKTSTFWSERLADIAPVFSAGVMKIPSVGLPATVTKFVASYAVAPLVRLGAKKWKASTQERNRKRLQEELDEKLPQFLEDFECALDDALQKPLAELSEMHDELVNLPQIFAAMEREQQQTLATLEGIRDDLDQRILERIAGQALPQIVRVERKLHDTVALYVKRGTALPTDLCERLEKELQEHVQIKQEGDS